MHAIFNLHYLFPSIGPHALLCVAMFACVFFVCVLLCCVHVLFACICVCRVLFVHVCMFTSVYGYILANIP